MATPKSFKDLSAEQLQVAADAFGVDAGNTKAVTIIELEENGVTWDQYKAAFLKEETPVTEATAAAPTTVITSGDVSPVRAEEPVVPSKVTTIIEEEVVTQPSVRVLPQADYLIKMERENPYFEFGKYKFSDKNPYQIMPAADAQAILVSEDGFRQAFPEELADYFA